MNVERADIRQRKALPCFQVKERSGAAVVPVEKAAIAAQAGVIALVKDRFPSRVTQIPSSKKGVKDGTTSCEQYSARISPPVERKGPKSRWLLGELSAMAGRARRWR